MGKASGNCERKMTTHKRKRSKMLRARQSRKIPPTNGMANTNSSNNHRKFKWLHVGFSWGFPGVFIGSPARVDDEVAHKHTHAAHQKS